MHRLKIQLSICASRKTGSGQFLLSDEIDQSLAGRTALGADAGVTHTTARHWLSVLEASYVVFRLPPYHGNVRKRLVKSPKLYFYDTGLAS